MYAEAKWNTLIGSNIFCYMWVRQYIECFKIVNRKHMAYSEPCGIFDVQCKWYSVLTGWQLLIMNRIRQKFKMKMAASMSFQRKRKRSEKQDNTGRHQLYDWTKRTRKFSLKWKDDFPQDSLEENKRICQRSWQWQHVICDVSATLFPEFLYHLQYDYTKFTTLYAPEVRKFLRDYNEIYLSIFSVFHEIMLCAKWTSRNDDRISTFRGSLQARPYCTCQLPFWTCNMHHAHFNHFRQQNLFYNYSKEAA